MRFRGGRLCAWIPLAGFVCFAVVFLSVLHVYEMSALVLGAFASLILGSFFVGPKHYGRYWEGVYDGMRSGVPILAIQMVVGMFAALIQACGVSSGFVWLSQTLGMHGSAFTAFTFLAACVIATATGTSLGTMFVSFPVFYPSGVMMGADPAMIAGAIVSGAIFGDHVAPVSDTTIVSASTQHYASTGEASDIGGCVVTRMKYALIAAAISFMGYLTISGQGGGADAAAGLSASEAGDPITLVMLAVVVFMLVIAVMTRDILKAISWGLVVGTVVSLLSGILVPADILAIEDGAPAGFLIDGIESMMPVAMLTICIYGISGVLMASGELEAMVSGICASRFCKTQRGTEMVIMFGISLTTLALCGITTPAIALFGAMEDDLGKRAGLHPYRRANLLDGFANGIVLVVPYMSALVLIASTLTAGYAGVPQLAPEQISGGMLYCYLITIVLFISVVTGWGRLIEAEPVEEKFAEAADA